MKASRRPCSRAVSVAWQVEIAARARAAVQTGHSPPRVTRQRKWRNLHPNRVSSLSTRRSR